MLNKNDITKIIKEKPLHSGIAGIAIIFFMILVLSLLFGDDDSGINASSFRAKKGSLRISITETGTIQAKEKIIVKNGVEGNTSIIFIIDEGTKVKKGDLLVELDSSTLLDQKIDQEIRVQNAEASFISARENFAVTKNQAKSDVDKAQLAYVFAKQDLDKYIKGEYPNQLKQSESKITIANEEYTRAEDKLKWSKKLYSEQYLSESELKADQLAEKQKKLSLELAQNDLKLLENYTHKRKMDQLESDVKQAEMALERTTRKAKADIVQSEASLKAKGAEFNRQKDKLEKIGKQIKMTKIYAPADGLALYATSSDRGHRFGRSEEPPAEGSSVRERQELIHLPTTTGFNVELGIYESSLDKVKPGLTVLITPDALPDKRFRGKVVSVAPVPDAMSSFLSPDLKIYDTVIEVLDSDNYDDINLLKSGMSCETEIIVKQYEDAVYIPVQAVIRVNGIPTVYLGKGDNPEPQEVEIGLDNNRMIIIIKGIEEGDVVSLTPPLNQAEVTVDNNAIIDDIAIDPASGSPVKQSPRQSMQPDGPSQGFEGPPGGFGGDMSNMQMPSKEDMMERMDQDGDGKVAKSEMRFGAERFDEMDKNGDGFITADEFEMPSFGGGGRGGMQGGDRGNMQMPSKDEMFKMTDQNGDGKIEKSEMRFGAEGFDEMDKNGDGFITPDEFEIPSFGGGGRGGMQGGSFPSGGSR